MEEKEEKEREKGNKKKEKEEAKKKGEEEEKVLKYHCQQWLNNYDKMKPLLYFLVNIRKQMILKLLGISQKKVVIVGSLTIERKSENCVWYSWK